MPGLNPLRKGVAGWGEGHLHSLPRSSARDQRQSLDGSQAHHGPQLRTSWGSVLLPRRGNLRGRGAVSSQHWPWSCVAGDDLGATLGPELAAPAATQGEDAARRGAPGDPGTCGIHVVRGVALRPRLCVHIVLRLLSLCTHAVLRPTSCARLLSLRAHCSTKWFIILDIP